MRAQALVSWLSSQAGVVSQFAEKYVSLLMEKNIGSVDKLARRLERNPKLLQSLGFDDDYDIERISAALSSYSNSSSSSAEANPQLQQRLSNRRHTFGAAGGEGRMNGTVPSSPPPP